MPDRTRDSSPDTIPLSVRSLRKQFSSVVAVDDVSFDVPPHEIFALLGPNGAGKTTTLRMLLGLLEPDSGAIDFGRGAGRRPDARDIGYLPEERGLYLDVAVIRTLVYFATLRGMERRAARRAAEAWLERLALAERANEPLKSLSKGNQQKVQFISAVLHHPRFLVLDEPFSGLDPLNQDLFLALIRELRAGGATIILSAHQMQLVERLADRVLVLNRGEVVLSGTAHELRRRWTTGSRLRIRTGSPAPADLFAMRAPRVVVEHVGAEELELFVADGEPLGAVLAEVGTALDVHGIESHPVTLHDVYVGTIARHDAERARAGGA